MKQLHFETLIAAPRQRVWTLMLAKPSYEEWTAAFCAGSSYEGDWSPGSEMRFTGPDGGGMLAEVLQNQAGERVQLRHRGELLPGGAFKPGDGWDSADESYFFSDAPEGGTRLQVQMDCAPAYEEMMLRLWPQALAKLKALCERASV